MPPKNGINKKCVVCGKEFYVQGCRIETAKYCSNECHAEGKKNGVQRSDAVVINNADGTVSSERRFEGLREGQNLTHREVLEKHGFDPSKWEITHCINNFWNSQLEGGFLQISYQSKITVRPTSAVISFEDVERFFNEHDFKVDKPLVKVEQYDPGGEVLEIDIPDVHVGLLAWRNETGEDYDLHIARDRFMAAMQDIRYRCAGRKFKKIVISTLGDLMHIDNDKQETTKGTFQNADGRFAKIFDETVEMLIDGITLFGDVAPVEVIYVCGNHDRIAGYGVLRTVEMAFKQDYNVQFDTTPNPQKYRRWGVNLVGFTHGDMPKKYIATWLLQAARSELSYAKYVEVHAGHFHSQIASEKPLTTDGDSGIVVRYLPALCGASYWEHQQGFPKSGKTVVSFVWHEEKGLRDMWFNML